MFATNTSQRDSFFIVYVMVFCKCTHCTTRAKNDPAIYLVAVCRWLVHWYNSMELDPCAVWVTGKHVFWWPRLSPELHMTAQFWNHYKSWNWFRSETTVWITHLPYEIWKINNIKHLETWINKTEKFFSAIFGFKVEMCNQNVTIFHDSNPLWRFQSR